MDRSLARSSADREWSADKRPGVTREVRAAHVKLLLGLQRAAGNAAVTGLLEGQRGETGSGSDARARFEDDGAIGARFSRVRLHRGPAASRATAALGARADTIGDDGVLGNGGGDEVTLARELTRIVRQRAGSADGTGGVLGPSIGDPDDPMERTAAPVAADVVEGRAPQSGLVNSARKNTTASTTAMAVAQRALVHGAGGAVAEYDDKQIYFDSPTGLYVGPRGQKLIRDADGSYSPAPDSYSPTPETTASNPTATTSSHDGTPDDLAAAVDKQAGGLAEGVDEQGARFVKTPSGRAHVTNPPVESSNPKPLSGPEAWVPSRRVLVHDATGASREYSEGEIHFESPTGLYIGPKGEKLVRSADGSSRPPRRREDPPGRRRQSRAPRKPPTPRTRASTSRAGHTSRGRPVGNTPHRPAASQVRVSPAGRAARGSSPPKPLASSCGTRPRRRAGRKHWRGPCRVAPGSERNQE